MRSLRPDINESSASSAWAYAHLLGPDMGTGRLEFCHGSFSACHLKNGFGEYSQGAVLPTASLIGAAAGQNTEEPWHSEVTCSEVSQRPAARTNGLMLTEGAETANTGAQFHFRESAALLFESVILNSRPPFYFLFACAASKYFSTLHPFPQQHFTFLRSIPVLEMKGSVSGPDSSRIHATDRSRPPGTCTPVEHDRWLRILSRISIGPDFPTGQISPLVIVIPVLQPADSS